jgi:preprotein translocase subunit SecA
MLYTIILAKIDLEEVDVNVSHIRWNHPIFKFEAEKQEFEDKNVFVLFDSILSLNENYSTKILEILQIYTKRYTIPTSTIQALENALGFPEQFEKAFLIFHNVIRNGQPVTNKILQILADILYMSINARRRYNSFKLLEKARQNQDLPESIFYQIELAKAGFALSRSTNKKSIMKFMQDQTNNGMQLPIDTVNALENETDNEDALQVLYNISKNKQIIQYDLLNKLIEYFNPNSDQFILIGVFENVAKNNQTLSTELINKLEMALNRKQIEDKVLSIFVYLAQKGEKLCNNIIQKILNKILLEKDIMLKQELLSALGSLIETHHTDIKRYQGQTEKILVNGINSDNINLQKICIHVLRILARFIKINSSLFDAVITIGTGLSCDRTIKEEIYSLFTFMEQNNSELTSKYKAKIQLANLDYQSNSELLNKLKAYANHEDGLLEQNYNQLKNIIDQDFQLQEKALEILHLLKAKNKMTDDLIESIVLLYESTNSKEIKNSCSKLLEDANRSGKNLNDRAAKIVNEKLKNDKADQIEQAFSQTKLYKELNTRFQLNNEQIKELLTVLKIKSSLLDIQNIEDLIQMLISTNPLYYNSQAFVFLIEQVLLTNICNEITLTCYCRIIKEKKYQKVEKVLDKLVQTYNESSSLLPLLMESIFHSLKYCHLSESCITLLENNLDHDDRLIRSFSFKGLRMILNKSESKKFQDWCDFTIENLSNAGVHIEKVKTYLDVLEIIVSLEFIDLDVLKKNDKEKWTRELIISSLFEHFKACDTEQIDFYSNWFIIEEKFMYYKSVKMLSLIMQRVLNFKSITEIIDIFICIRTRLYDDVMIILNNHEFSYNTLKENWCMEMMKNRLINKNIDENYLNRLCKNVCITFNIKFIESLFKCISWIDNLREFEQVIKFCSTKAPNLGDLCFQNIDITQLKSLLEANHICNKIKTNGEKQSYRDVLFNNLCLLIKKKWTFDQLDELTESFNSMNSNRKLENYISILELINQYNLSSSQYKKCSQLIRESNTFIQLLKGLNKLVIENNFQLKGKVKSSSELLNELEETNKNNPILIKYIRTELPKELEEIKKEDLKSLIQYNQLPIAEWGVKQINHWSDKIKSTGEQFSNVEAIAVIKRANFLFTGYHLTDTQILCTLIALKTESKTRGKLLQVATGEGKSTIVCILAIINALKNKQVHVITSSPVLAERDSKQKMKLFKMFHLTCSDNNDKTVYLYGRKDCYTADIVYGEVSQFQFDTLRDQYSMLGTLGNRKCEIAIVDEVDSMLIDDSSKIARLSSTAAGMDYFQVIYVYIWQRLLTVKERFIMFNNTMYMVNGKVGFENGKILLEYLDDNNNIIKISDLESYVSKNKDISDIGEVINGDLDDYLKKCLDEYLASLISEKKLEIPKNYKEFYETQKPKWIHNAIEALNYQENIHYVVQEGQIKPVDYYSTGIVQSSTNWSDGLHQFLQIKHNLKMTSETFTTNFLSNIGFVNNYKNIYGLTGTLGSEKAKKVLKDVYNVDLVNVPQLRQKQYLELETIVTQDETKWVEQICSTVLIETKKDRGVLIICENIAHANRLGDLLKIQHRSTAVKLYTMNNMNQEKHVEKILPGEIIIATNLAGRGTDIRTDEIEEFGGLHVVLTFMPSNQRVEDQAFGRTARQGKRGTGLMILNSMNLIDYNHVNTTEVKLQRDIIESNMLNEFQNNELKLIQIKDKLFKQFCTFLNGEIRHDIRYKQGCFQPSLNAVTDVFKTVMPTVYETNIITAAEEQWAIFLRKLDDDTIPLDHAEEECNKLIDILRNDYKEDKIIKNSYYHTVIANDIIMNEWSISNSSKAKHALSHFEKAVQLDEAASGAAHLGIAWCALIIQDENYKKKALESFEKSLKILSNEMAMLNSMQLLLEQKQPTFTGSELYKQLMTKVTILGTYLNSVQGNIGAIKKSLRLIDLIEIKQHSNNNVLEKIEYYYECERNNKKKLEIKMDKQTDYTLIFNDLTWREDSGTIDQALITIENAYHKDKLSSSYHGISITLKQAELDRIKAIFNQNKEYLDLTKESAIDKLKNERTMWNTLRITSSYQIDLKIIHSDNKTEEFKNKQINELITLIETKTDDTLRFNIIIKDANANEVNKYFKNTTNDSANLQVDFDRLDFESIDEKLSSIKAKSINIEMVLTKSILLPIIDRNKCINSAKVCVTEQKLYEKINRNELVKRVTELKNDDSYFYIKFESLQTDQIRNIIFDCKEMSFNISFIGIDFYNSINGLNGQANFHFNNLNKITSEIIIKDLRKENIEFSLEFQCLKDHQVEYIVIHANLDQENIQISKVKNLMELYTKGSMPTVELNEFTAKGIEHMIEINEKRFVPWRSVIVVAILGSLQIIAGGVLIATGFGSTVGMGLITEGIADMFTAYRAFSNRQFNWGDYCKQKAVSLVISAVSMGYSKLKDAGKGVKTLVGSAGTEALEQAGTQFAANTKTIGQTVAQTGKNLKSLAFKYTGVKAGEAVAREGLNSGVQYLSKFSFDLIKPQISESVQSKIRVIFSKPDLTYLLRKMYALDLQTKSKILQCKVDQIVADTINPRHDFARRQWDSIGGPLLKGVLADAKNYGSAISMTIRIIGTLNGLHTLQTLINNVYTDLVKKLSQIDKNTMTITLILHRNLKIEKENARSIVNQLKDWEIIDENDNLKLSSYYDVNDECIELKRKIDKFNRKENQDDVAKFMKSFCDQYMQIEYDSFSIISKSVADKITEQLIQIIESQLIQPWSTLAVSSLTSNLSNRIQHNYLIDKNQNSDSHNKDQEKYDKLKNKTNLTEEEKTFMKNYGKYRTFAEQINYNSRDYCVAYTQCEVAYYAKTSSTVQNGKEVDKKVEERADDVRDNKPATMAEISLMMEKYGIKLKIVNDENYQRTQEEIDNDVEVIYVEKDSKDDKNADQVGHAYYIDAHGNRFDVETKPNDCFYGVFSKILETKGINKSIENIRNELADDIKSNANYSKVMEAEKWIHDRHPQEANSLLFSAGLRLVPSASYRQDGVKYEQLQEKKRQNQNLTEEDEKFIEDNDRQQQGQARYEHLKEKERQKQNLTEEEKMLIKDYESKGHLEVEPKDLKDLHDSVWKTDKRGKPHGKPFQVSILLIFFS